MKETYKFLSKLITKNWKDKSNEDICRIYQETKQDELLAYEFCKNYNILNFLLHKYGFFIEEDLRSSYVLEYLNIAMTTFDCGGKTRFLTYLTTVMRNRLITTNRKSAKNKALLDNTVSYDDLISEDNENSFDTLFDSGFEKEYEKAIMKMDVFNNSNLNQKEMDICNLIVDGRIVHKSEAKDTFNFNNINGVYSKIKRKLSNKEEYLRSR